LSVSKTGANVAFMISRDYLDFIEKMDTHYPRFGEQYKIGIRLRAGAGRRQGFVNEKRSPTEAAMSN